MDGINNLLEDKSVKISVSRKSKKVSVIEGMVTKVWGINNQLRIDLDSRSSTYRINSIIFNGESPVRMGDRIRAGLIISPEFPKEAVYIGLLKDASSDGVYERIDCMRNYDPLHVDWKKMGLQDY